MKRSPSVLAANLTRIAKSNKVSRKTLAEAAGLSASMIGRIMRGEADPNATHVRIWAKLLDIPVGKLFTPAPQLSHIRFRSSKSRLNVRQEVLFATAAWLRSFNELESMLNDRIELCLDLKRHGRESPEHAALRLRAEMNLEDDEPVLDICGLLESRGVKVFAQHKISDGFYGLAVGQEDGGPAVVVNCNPQINVERWIFSAAHELGHLVMHKSSFKADEKKEIEEEEAEANCFASHFLMPEVAFSSMWEASKGLHPVDRVIKVKRHFTVSYLTVLRRLIDTGRSDQRVYASFNKLFKKRYKRSLKGHHEMAPAKPSSFSASFSDEPEHLNPLDFQPERLARLVREALDEELLSTSRAADILGVGFEEMRNLRAAWVDDMVTC